MTADKHTYMMIACVAVGVVLCCMAATPLFGGPLSTVLALIPGGLLIAAGMTIEELADDLAEPRAWCATPKADTPSAAPYWLDEHRDDLRPGRTICPGDDDYPDGPNWIKHKEIG